MKSFLKFLLIAAAVLLLSCVTAPILFNFLPYKFEKIFNRLIMIFTLVSAAIFVRLDFKKMASYGLVKTPDWKRQLAVGFGGGLLTLIFLTAVKMAFGNAHWHLVDWPLHRWFFKVISVFFSALLIGFIEEFFFRGMVFQGLLKMLQNNRTLAVIVTSLFYSVVHFVSIKKPFIGPDPGIMDSFKLLTAPLLSLAHWQGYWRGAIGLFIFGVVLNCLSVRTRALYASIGLHAGCVFFIKLAGRFAEFSNAAPLIWGSSKMYDSLAGWAALVLMGWGLLAAVRILLEDKGSNLKARNEL